MKKKQREGGETSMRFPIRYLRREDRLHRRKKVARPPSHSNIRIFDAEVPFFSLFL